MVDNGSQGLTQEEIMQKKREEFFKKRMGGPSEKARQVHLWFVQADQSSQRAIADNVSRDSFLL